jgi:uncharacterized membrane protein
MTPLILSANGKATTAVTFTANSLRLSCAWESFKALKLSHFILRSGTDKPETRADFSVWLRANTDVDRAPECASQFWESNKMPNISREKIMQEFESATTINALPDHVFAFVSDLNNLPQYLPTVQRVQAESGNRIRIQGQMPGENYNETGFFYVDPQNQRMEWGSDGANGYQGWLQVQPISGNACEITVHLSFDPQGESLRKMDQRSGDRTQAINDGLEKTLQSIKKLCEGRVSKAAAARQQR